MHELPAEIANDLGGLLNELAALGFAPRANGYSPQCMGNWYVDFSGPKRSLRLIRDRSQYVIDGNRKDLEPIGLWQAFNDRGEFARKLLSWLERERDKRTP